MKTFFQLWNNISLVKRIIVGLAIGILLGFVAPQAQFITIFGSLFVGALKGAAPILVLFLVMSALSKHKAGKKTNMKLVLILYLIGTFVAGCLAVVASFLFPVTLVLPNISMGDITPPEGIVEVLRNLVMNLVSNPVTALMEANYIGILAWAILLGVALRHSSEYTKVVIDNLADAISQVIRWIISFAPLGVMGIVYQTVSEQGVDGLKKYVHLIILLVGVMAVDAF